MIALETTWQYVVMLLVAAGVGVIGGIGAALIEAKTNVATDPPRTTHWLLDTATCIVLGGIAAVAVLYFFLPTKEVIAEGGGGSKVSYELIKLVALSLIVGSAGTVFVQNFQKRIEGALAVQAGNQAVVDGQKAVVAAQALPKQADESLEGAKSNFQVILQDQIPGMDTKQAGDLADKLVDEAKNATGGVIQKQVDTIQVLAEPVAPDSIIEQRQALLKRIKEEVGNPPIAKAEDKPDQQSNG